MTYAVIFMSILKDNGVKTCAYFSVVRHAGAMVESKEYETQY